MVAVTYSTLHSLLHLVVADISAADTENLIDQAIDKLNLYGLGAFTISNLTGAAGSKTVTVTSQERGAIMEVASSIYYLQYKEPSGMSISSLSQSPPTTAPVDEVAKRNAKALASRTHVIYRI